MIPRKKLFEVAICFQDVKDNIHHGYLGATVRKFNARHNALKEKMQREHLDSERVHMGVSNSAYKMLICYLMIVVVFQSPTSLRNMYMRRMVTKEPHLTMGRKRRKRRKKQKLKRKVYSLYVVKAKFSLIYLLGFTVVL